MHVSSRCVPSCLTVFLSMRTSFCRSASANAIPAAIVTRVAGRSIDRRSIGPRKGRETTRHVVREHSYARTLSRQVKGPATSQGPRNPIPSILFTYGVYPRVPEKKAANRTPTTVLLIF
eukprot:4685478-Prymnesium_polylepis.3